MGRPGKWQADGMLQKLVQNARQHEPPLHWLDLQNADRYEWEQVIGQGPKTKGRRAYYRRLGLVEGLFDSDGTLSCGRADLQQNHYYEIKTSLDDAQLRERIVLAWTLMRHRHVLLSSQAMFLHEIVPRKPNHKWTERCFLYRCPRSMDEAVEETREHICFVEDTYPDVDVQQFYRHSMNTNRVLDARKALSRLYVMPVKRTSSSTIRLHFMPIFAHQVTDGITMYRWTSSFATILNMNEAEIRSNLESMLSNPIDTIARLPPSQESLYPRRSQSTARQRWHWLITRILRHVRVPPPAGFPNPLRRTEPLSTAQPFQPIYPKLLDYDTTPPLNGGRVGAKLNGVAAHTLNSLCKQANISKGSGTFVLVAITMMILEERQNPDTPLASRLPFVGYFPVNPRPFLNSSTAGQETSCMLAFSDGVTLPFLPSSLPFAGRFKLLGRLAHRQLRQFQKRPRSLTEEVALGSRSPNQLLPSLYCATFERLDARYPPDQQADVTVQGAYPARVSPGRATCGISSVGDISSVLTPPVVDLERDALSDEKDLIARYVDNLGAVRPRESEFLVGATGDSRVGRYSFNVSYDACAIDPGKVGEWKRLMEEILVDVDVDMRNDGGRKVENTKARL